MAKTEQEPLTKDGVTRRPGTPTERVQWLAQGWVPEKPAKQTHSGSSK